ncbi:uncharacterized protein E0L32_012278 [Thyridium curvatum]|uniref:Uncharacterized protein n=1 Tax=Thyridium curvatum TaxID=1093900 RepID=A0A507B1T3_9PEZI|nr:uncharacterized protein E0L32_012278 [Thyridium curvatum]TPX17065.1 hypothetical protein E0L32_012278 [Thyridium curvatum]
MSAFTIKAAPNTDIWRKPPTTDVFNAPTAIPAGHSPPRTTGPLSSFRSARATFSFSPSQQYDQAGLLLSLRRRGGGGASTSTSAASSGSKPEKWIKTGVEYYYAKPLVSTVACDGWADWSVAPLSGTPGATTAEGVTIEVVAEGDDKGRSFWVYQVLLGSGEGDAQKVPLREICWVAAKQEEWDLSVEAMAARPEAKATTDELSVEFREFDVQWA